MRLFLSTASRTALLFFIFAVCFIAGRAQLPPTGTVIPSVCVEQGPPQSGTTTLTLGVGAGANSINVASPIPLFSTMVINPGGANEETQLAGSMSSPTSLNITIRLSSTLGGAEINNNHAAGETVQWTYNGLTAYFGYNNTSSSVQTFPLGILTRNYFTPGAVAYSGFNQPSVFQPGIRHRVFSLNVPPRGFDWILNDGRATANGNSPRCATITYQGRLSNAGAAASGNFDLQFTLYDAATGGAAQSGTVTTANVPVSNGVFTVALNFGSALFGNTAARFLEIGVRPAGSTDAFTILAPRQPITDVPFAVNAYSAVTVANVTNATNGFNVSGGDLVVAGGVVINSGDLTIKNGNLVLRDNMLRLRESDDGNHGILYQPGINGMELRGFSGFTWKTGEDGANQRMRLDASGNLTVTGNLTVNGTITGSIPSAPLGQSVNTVSGTAALNITDSITSYTLVPGLTQTVNVPAGSSISFSTDGGIQSLGASNTFSVVDVAIFVDGSAVAQRRTVIGNAPLPLSVGNWSLSFGQTLAPGSHTIEVRARHGLNGSAESRVSSGSDSLLKGQLTVTVIKK